MAPTFQYTGTLVSRGSLSVLIEVRLYFSRVAGITAWL